MGALEDALMEGLGRCFLGGATAIMGSLGEGGTGGEVGPVLPQPSFMASRQA